MPESFASLSSIRVIPAAGATVSGAGKYRYIAALADGGMANVYLAVTQGTGFEKLFVIKQLRSSLAEDPSLVAMFMNEARLAARLNHPNVVQTYEVGSEGGIHYIAMEFLEGVSYARFARVRDRLPAPIAFHVRILVEVLRGLHYAHELRDFDGTPLRVVHRDVSPQNVMLTFAGGVKVLDFGIAQAALAKEQRPDEFKGKLDYASPEQALREPVDRRADVFSVGVMLWEALARRRLYEKGDDKFAKLATGRLPNVLDVRPDAPARLAQICSKALAHYPANRFETAEAMADALEEYLADTTQHVTPRDVGIYVSEKFDDTRRKLAAAIESQLKTFRALPANEVMAVSRIPTTEPPQEFVPDLPPPGGATRVMDPRTRFAPLSAPNPPQIARAPSPPSGAPQPFVVGLVAFIGVTILAGGIALALRARPQEPVSRAAPAVSSVAPEVAPAEIDFTIKASPASARILIDGKPQKGNPVHGRRPRDGSVHVVRAEAPGYEPRSEQVTFDRSFLVTLELKPRSAHASIPTEKPTPSRTPIASSPAPQPARPALQQPRPTAPPRPKTTGARKPAVNVDTENPY